MFLKSENNFLRNFKKLSSLLTSFLLMIAIVPGAAAMVQAEPVSQAQIISTEVSPEVISIPIPYFRNICMR